MASDKTLREKVEIFCARDEAFIFFNLEQTNRDIIDILLDWADIDTQKPRPEQTPEGLHPHVDEFLRKVFDLSPTTPVKNHPLLGRDPWNRLFRNYKAKLMLQCAGAKAFDTPVTYNYTRDLVDGTETLSDAFLDGFEMFLAQQQDKTPYVLNLTVFINEIAGVRRLSPSDKARLDKLGQ